MSSTKLTDLAKAILENASKLEQYFHSNELELPTFEEHYPPELPLTDEMQLARQKAVDSAMELQDLLVGPAMQLRPVLDATSLQAIYVYNIASKVPLNGRISYTELAEEVGLQQSVLQQLLRFAMVWHRVFQEKEPGFVSHTAASRYLAESPAAMAGLGFMFDETYQSFAHTVEALKAHENPGPGQSGWAVAMKTNQPLWSYHAKNPEMGQRAALAMESFTKGFNLDTVALLDGYDWSHIAADEGLLVDLGGANGHVAFEMVRANPGLRCVVQEIPEVVAKAQYKVPTDIVDRVTFEAHDFFRPQTTVAQAYLFRQVFHNLSDERCVAVLRALIPSLQRGAKVIINDIIVPPPGILMPMQERAVRSMDMIMMSLFNSRERERQDWEALFAKADHRFRDVKVSQPERSQLGLVLATWSG